MYFFTYITLIHIITKKRAVYTPAQEFSLVYKIALTNTIIRANTRNTFNNGIRISINPARAPCRTALIHSTISSVFGWDLVLYLSIHGDQYNAANNAATVISSNISSNISKTGAADSWSCFG